MGVLVRLRREEFNTEDRLCIVLKVTRFLGCLLDFALVFLVRLVDIRPRDVLVVYLLLISIILPTQDLRYHLHNFK